MSVADLRKELKELRKSVMPAPVSRMPKAEVAREIERLKSLHGKEEKKVEAVLEEAKVPKKIAKKVASVQETEHKKQEEVVKKTAGVKAKKEDAPKPKTDKPGKGSDEMKARMAKLREMRKKKAE